MADFEAKVYRIAVEEHPDADALELARVGEYRCVIAKGSMRSGDLAAYIPEAAIVPDWLLERMGLVGRLAGKKKNRVKAIRLRGVVSQGLVYGLADGGALELEEGFITVREGDDVAQALGLKKYEPPVPTGMEGEMEPCLHTLSYDIEDYKKHPDAFAAWAQETPDPEVVVTEKLHGTWACFGRCEDEGEMRHIVTSKGMSAKKLVFRLDSEKNMERNVYCRTWRAFRERLDAMADALGLASGPAYVLGEIYGRGVQDLHYGAQTPAFRVFDIYRGMPGHGSYMAWDELAAACEAHGFDTVPVLWRGAWDACSIRELASGRSSLDADCIREGAVVRPNESVYHAALQGRLILKYVSDEYLLRKGGTEYN